MKFNGMSIDFEMQSIKKLTEDHQADAIETFQRIIDAAEDDDRENFQDALVTLNEILGGHAIRHKQFIPG